MPYLHSPPGRAEGQPQHRPPRHRSETGLHYNLLRHYTPETGRYTSPDPLGLDPAPSPVAYVYNPFTVCDPLGLTSESSMSKAPSHGSNAAPTCPGPSQQGR
ncbi:RHS repeat-associated core domain-containing protein [Streptomyces sp. NPDC059970]|uniref:RHS repeat-associated core domain-containing protein n=1 Tax=Streptomyces sp. NPDC059970 TaxID=3347019 RepID=UPI00367B7F21